jgi:hypothetical protein
MRCIPLLIRAASALIVSATPGAADVVRMEVGAGPSVVSPESTIPCRSPVSPCASDQPAAGETKAQWRRQRDSAPTLGVSETM